MKCPHCKEETFSGFNILRSSENIFICKKCNKKSFFPSEKKFKSNPLLYTLAVFFMIPGIIITSPEIKFPLIIIALILVLLGASGKKTFPFKNDEELKRLKELLYSEDEEIDIRLFDYPNAITWYDNVKNNSDYSNKLGELYQKEILDYDEAIKWYKIAIKKNNLNAIENLSNLYFDGLNNQVKGTAYALSLIGTKYTKLSVLDFLRTKWNISDQTIIEGYSLQLKMKSLSRRYKGDLDLNIDSSSLIKETEPELKIFDKEKDLKKDEHQYKKIVLLSTVVAVILCSLLIYNLFSNRYDKRLDNYPYAKELYKIKDNFESSYRLGLFYLEKLEDKEKALVWLKKSSEDGSLLATIKLIEVDPDKNVWSEKAFNLGLDPIELARIDSNNSTRWLNKASEMGNCKAMKIIAQKIDKNYRYNLNNILDDIVLSNKERNFKKAIDWYEKAYQNGCKEVVNDIALLYRVNTTSHLRTRPKYSNRNNIGYINEIPNNINSAIDNNYKKAETWLIKGSKNGNAKSLSYLGDIYKLEKKNLPVAISYYKEAYLQGEKEAFKDIINIYKTLNNDAMLMYLYLKGLNDNDEYIIKELIMSFYEKRKYVYSSLLLNEIKDKDRFLTKNNIFFDKTLISKSKNLYNKINGKTLNYLFKEQKELFFDSRLDIKLYNNLSLSPSSFFTDPSITFELGKLYSRVFRDYSKALDYFQISYDIKENGITALKIGIMHIQLNNIKKGIKWLEKSFDMHNEINAAFNLGQVYKFKLKDYKKAIKWYKKSYKGGDVTSSYEIANIYENEYKDKKNAILWYEKSAKKGLSKSIYKLEIIKGMKNINKSYTKEIIDEEGNSELILAIFENNLKEIKVLIKKQVNINYINPNNNWTPLIAAIVNNNIKAVKLLINAGVSLDKSSLKVDHPLWISFINLKFEIGDLLIKSGVNINSLNSNGESLLHYFVMKNNYKIVKYLLDKGIDTSIKNKNNQTALEMAKMIKKEELIKLLKE